MSEKLDELLKLKSGGTYVPPAKLRALLADVELEQNSEKVQSLYWENLKKKINSIINKVNKENIKIMVVELFKLNLFRGKGLLCNSLIKSQQLSTAYTDVYASLVCVLNSKLPEIGKLLLNRLIIRYKRAFRREETEKCRSIVIFLSELLVFKVSTPQILMDIITQLLENPNNFKVEMVVEILNYCGVLLDDNESIWFDNIKNALRNILNENIVDNKSQFLIQQFFDGLKEKIEIGVEIPDELDLVEDDDCIIHDFSLNDKFQGENELDVFKFDEQYQVNNEKYNTLMKGILGSDFEGESDEEEGEEDEDDHNSDFSSDNENYDNEEDYGDEPEGNKKLTVQIKDLTEQELTNYKKNVYLTVMSSMSPEEATHKLLKLPAIDPDRREYMLIDMIIKCCAQEKVYSKYYGIIGENLVTINKKWSECFQELFKENYENCHKYEATLLRNLGAFWGHMFASDKLGWECLSVVKLTEEDTTSSSRILIKFMFQKMIEEIGINHLIERINEPYVKPFILGIFPKENAEHLRFSINYFTAIGMGKLTEDMRECLDNLPIDVPAIEDQSDENNDSTRGRSRSRSGSESVYSRSLSRERSYSRSRSSSPDRKEEDSRKRDRSPSEPRSRSRERHDNYKATYKDNYNDNYRNDYRNDHYKDRMYEIPRGPRNSRNFRGRGRGRGGTSYYRGGRYRDTYRSTYRNDYRGNNRDVYRDSNNGRV
jgi:pre-mRNA-splicing factor CWC22